MFRTYVGSSITSLYIIYRINILLLVTAFDIHQRHGFLHNSNIVSEMVTRKLINMSKQLRV